MKIQIAVLLTLILLGCSKRGSDQALTVVDWDILSNTHFGSAYIDYPDSTKQTVFPENSPEFRTLLKAFMPFSEIDEAAGSPFVEMTYFVRDAVTIEVRTEGEALIFNIRNRWYAGGNLEKFTETLKLHDAKDRIDH